MGTGISGFFAKAKKPENSVPEWSNPRPHWSYFTRYTSAFVTPSANASA